MSDFIISAFSDEYATPFEEQLEGMKSLGIENIELRFVDGKNVSEISIRQAKEIKKMLDEAKIKVSAIGSPIGKVSLDEDLKEHFDTAKKFFEIATVMETKLIRMFSFYSNENQDIQTRKDEVLKALGVLLDLAKQYRLTLCLENEAELYCNTPAYCHELLKAFGGELKCVFDMGNYVLEGEKPYPDNYQLLKSYIEYFHIKDALYEGAIVPAGKGEAKIKEILEAHRQYAKEDFFVSLEPHLQTFSGLNALKQRDFDNPYKYEDLKSAFIDHTKKFKEMF